MTPALVTIPNVELAEVGEWQLMSGPTYFSQEDLAAAVAALDDPFIRTPILKIGHTDPRLGFDGNPCLGKIENLRLDNNGMTLVGDLVGVPQWLASIMPVAYPTRSIEATRNWKTAQGKEHLFVLNALSLLGEMDPGVSTLDDLPLFFGKEVPPVVASYLETVKAANKEGRVPGKVAASVEVDEVRKAYYATLDASQMWWWIRAIYVDPQEVIVDDDEGGLYRVPFNIKGEEIDFGEPQKVRIEYVDVAASAGASAVVYASRADSRPDNPRKEDSVTPTIRARLGLAEDATEEQVLAAIEELQERPTSETPPEGQPDDDGSEDDDDGNEPEAEQPTQPEGVQIPEGMVLVDAGTLETLRNGAQAGVEARGRQLAEDKAKLLDGAVRAGKIPPSRRQHWAAMYDKDPKGTKKFIDDMPEDMIPVAERGTGATDESLAAGAGGDAYPSHWFPEVNRANNGQPAEVR